MYQYVPGTHLFSVSRLLRIHTFIHHNSTTAVNKPDRHFLVEGQPSAGDVDAHARSWVLRARTCGREIHSSQHETHIYIYIYIDMGLSFYYRGEYLSLTSAVCAYLLLFVCAGSLCD